MYNAVGQLIKGYASSKRQQIASAITAVGVNSHQVIGFQVERCSIGQRGDLHLLALGTGDIYRVLDASSRIEVKCKVYKAIAAVALLFDLQQMVIRALHLIGPVGIRSFEQILHLLPCKPHGVELVFVLVEIKHITHADIACRDCCIVGQRSDQRDLRTRDLQLERVQ